MDEIDSLRKRASRSRSDFRSLDMRQLYTSVFMHYIVVHDWISLESSHLCLRINVVICNLLVARSKVTAQGKTCIPADVRRKLGIGPGSVLEWEEEGDRVIIRRSARFSSEQIHQAIFAEGMPSSRSIEEIKKGIVRRAQGRYGRAVNPHSHDAV